MSEFKEKMNQPSQRALIQCVIENQQELRDNQKTIAGVLCDILKYVSEEKPSKPKTIAEKMFGMPGRFLTEEQRKQVRAVRCRNYRKRKSQK